MAKKIKLTQGYEAIVDDDDYEFLSQWSWYINKRRYIVYALRDIRVGGKKRHLWMHRVINNTPDDLYTDHINGNGLDNRRSNLRTVTHQQNMLNTRVRKKAKYSKHRGVTWHKLNKKWYSQITVDRKNVYLGSFDTEEEAKAVYDAYRKEVIKSKFGGVK